MIQYSLIYIKMLWTFVGEPALSKHIQQFHRAVTRHYSQEGKHLFDRSWNGSFLWSACSWTLWTPLQKHCKWWKGEALQKVPENSKYKSCVNVTQRQFLLQSCKSLSYMCFLFLWKTPMLLSPFPVLIYSCTDKRSIPHLIEE